MELFNWLYIFLDSSWTSNWLWYLKHDNILSCTYFFGYIMRRYLEGKNLVIFVFLSGPIEIIINFNPSFFLTLWVNSNPITHSVIDLTFFQFFFENRTLSLRFQRTTWRSRDWLLPNPIKILIFMGGLVVSHPVLKSLFVGSIPRQRPVFLFCKS